MDDKAKDSSDLDELKNSIEESAQEAAAKPVKINIKDHDEADEAGKPDDMKDETGSSKEKEVSKEEDLENMKNEASDVDEQDPESNEESDDEDSKSDDEPEEAEEDSVKIQQEIEKEFEDETEDLTEEEPKKAGPAGPYEPKVPEGDDETAEKATQKEEAEEVNVEGIDVEKDIDTSSEEPEKNVDKAVDELLSVEPQAAQAAAAAATAAESSSNNKSLKSKIGRFFKAWWRNKKARYGTLIGLFIVLTVISFVPTTRYAALNLIGVRVSSSLSIVDSETGLPLENIPVSLAGQQLRSGEDGLVEFSNLKLGSNKLVIDKLGYASFEKDLVLGLGSNPLGPQSLTATGAQYRFTLVDWLSKQALIDAEAISGEDIAQADEKGKILLTVGDLSNGAEVRITAPGYREETFLISDLDEEEQNVSMVPAKKHVFVSNRSGDYDLYKIDVDGENEELLLEATGKEREIPYVLPHQERSVAAYITSRDGERNEDGFILDGLFIIKVDTGEVERITRSEQLQIVGWLDSKLVYVAVVEGVSAGNPQRSKVFSYDIDSGERYELASSNYFNDVKLVGSSVYYSVSSASVPQSQAKLFSVNADGTNKQIVVDTQVWSIVREDYNSLLFNAIDREWYAQEIGQAANKLDEQPSNTSNRNYADSPNGKRAVWIDVRDGKGVLLSYDVESGQDSAVLTLAGLTEPVYWLSDKYVVFRVDTSGETADFVLNLDGGEPMKISDVVGNRSRYFY